MVSSRAFQAASHRATTTAVAVRVASVAAATATANNEGLIAFPGDAVIQSILFIPDTTQAGADTDSRTMVIRNVADDGEGDADIAEFEQTEGADLTAHVPQALVLDASKAFISAGDVLVYRSVKVGEGEDTPAGTIVISYI